MNAQPVDVLARLKTTEDMFVLLTGEPLTSLPIREVREAVAELAEDLKRIQRRAAAHPDDNDADRKRNLYHIESIARLALARMEPQS